MTNKANKALLSEFCILIINKILKFGDHMRKIRCKVIDKQTDKQLSIREVPMLQSTKTLGQIVERALKTFYSQTILNEKIMKPRAKKNLAL